MKKSIMAVIFLGFICSFAFPGRSYAENKWERMVTRCGKVLREVQEMPDENIPDDLLRDCAAIAIFPDTVSAGIGIGGKFGQGVILVKKEQKKMIGKERRWSAPAIFTIAGGSLGWQIGGQATDIVLLIMSEKSVEGILDGKFKLGADAAIAAGPVGRDAQAATDAALGGILSYSRTRGLFVGVRLEGDIITEHWDGNEALYGKKLSAEEILIENKVSFPGSAGGLRDVLDEYI